MGRIVFVVLFVVILSGSLFAQSKLEKARQCKENYQFSQAILLYKDYFKNSTPKNVKDIKDIAHCYIMINDLAGAQEWLSKIGTFTVYSPQEMLDYAMALKSMGCYDSAINQYKRFGLIFTEKSAQVAEWVAACKTAKEWIANPLPYEITNVTTLNSEYAEFGLTPYKNGYMFSSDRKATGVDYKEEEIFGWTGTPFLRFYGFSGMEEYATSGSPVLARGINSTYHNGPGVFDFKTDVFYFTITKSQKEKPLPVNSDPTSFEDKKPAEKFVDRLEIFSAILKGDEWINVQPFEYNNAENYSVGHPAISPDGNILYFVSDMPGGLGNCDIYYCRKQPDGKWSVPQNAGPVINTEGKEAFPVIDRYGNLYFSSNGLPGLGGLDIFKTTGSCETWTKPENLRYPINSPKDDFSPYIPEPGESGYFSSNRDGGKGGDDIYFFSRRIIIVGTVKATLLGKNLEILPGAIVRIKNITQNKSDSILTDNNGKFIEKSRCGNKYNLTALKYGYLKQEKTAEAACIGSNDTVYVELVLDKLMESKSFVLENIYYDFDKWDIRPDAAVELDKLVKILTENPQIDIELGSHTDCRGKDTYNQKLSQKRAESAVAYIVSKGVAKRRIVAKGYGESKPRVPCLNCECSDADHQMNRRTEFTITRIHNQ